MLLCGDFRILDLHLSLTFLIRFESDVNHFCPKRFYVFKSLLPCFRLVPKTAFWKCFFWIFPLFHVCFYWTLRDWNLRPGYWWYSQRHNHTGIGGSQVVSVITFYFDDVSSNPAKAYNSSVKYVFGKNENEQKEAVIGIF